mmetsp:Transcript_98280/g.174170  ORF Transcript_98280/g.174170 Transcript_98280/m.174170 type:complete len:621 (-) Transcript_98280:154-2016(-)
MSGLRTSQSLPGLHQLGCQPNRFVTNNARRGTLSFRADSPVDLHAGMPPSEDIIRVASCLKSPGWRLMATKDAARSGPVLDEMPGLPKNVRHPRIAPAWLKHDKQVLRFYAFFQEAVTERADENCRYRHCVIMYFMEDGTMRVSEPKVENSGIPQGQFLKRHRVMKPDGTGFYGPNDFQIGEDTHIYGRTFHITGCDRFTRWFFEENGIQLGPDEPVVEDMWERGYKFMKTAEKGGLAVARNVVEAKNLNKYTLGIPPPGRGLTQFLENDRKVLRFYAYWDDNTLYGVRLYFVCHFFLADNTFEMNEAHARNSGRDNFPVFYKRGKLLKVNCQNAYPGMLEPDPLPYLPEDFIVGEPFYVWGRECFIYDCDDFTRDFYKDYLGIDQKQNVLDVSEPPIRHVELNPPPHNGVGTEEDSLINCKMVQPKPPKQDLVRLMTLSGEILRFEAKLVNGQPEDEIRKFIIGFFPADFNVAVWELQLRNSGVTGGKFCEKSRMKNPETGKYFELADFGIGKTVIIKSHPLHILRADEHTLLYSEAHPEDMPYADALRCASRLRPLAGAEFMQDPSGVDPDQLREAAASVGVDLIDHELITLLRAFGVDGMEGIPLISGPKVLSVFGM